MLRSQRVEISTAHCCTLLVNMSTSISQGVAPGYRQQNVKIVHLLIYSTNSTSIILFIVEEISAPGKYIEKIGLDNHFSPNFPLFLHQEFASRTLTYFLSMSLRQRN